MHTKLFFKTTNDIMFKSIFCDENNRDLLEQLIQEAIDKKVKVISLKAPELRKDNIKVKGKTLDIIAVSDIGEINIELNVCFYQNLHRRNACYVFKRYSNDLNVSESYSKMKHFIQINLTLGPDWMPYKARYIAYDPENHLQYVDNLEIYEINLNKAKELWYNKNEQSLLSILDLEREELEKVNGDELMEKLKKEVNRLNEDKEFIEFLSAEEEEQLFMNTIKQEEFDKGLNEGIEQGIEQTNLEIAKKMLKRTDDLDFIQEITGLSIDKLQTLK